MDHHPDHHEFLHELALDLSGRDDDGDGNKVVLLVLDGVGDIVTADQSPNPQPRTPLDRADTPNLDALAARSALGRIVPVAQGVTPGSGPGHLALFGYDPMAPETDIGRGVLEALGVGMEVKRGDVLARGNFATADASGELVDRRAGRPSNDENRRLVAAMQESLDGEDLEGVEARLHAGEGHRFVLRLRGDGLSAALRDTDPQTTGVAPKPPAADSESPSPETRRTVGIVERVVSAVERALADEDKANRALLRGFSSLPHLPPMNELYRLRCGAFAGYPLYRGVASVCGMEVVECGKGMGEVVDAVARHWEDFDYFFLHLKKPDMAGEDGDADAKARAIEAADAEIPRLMSLGGHGPAALAITGDHSTPAPMAGHSWHPVPLLLHSRNCFVDETRRFTELEAIRGHVGTIPSMHLMGLLLANAGRLAKYGA